MSCLRKTIRLGGVARMQPGDGCLFAPGSAQTISSFRRPPIGRAAGFTLIEVMVVLVIMGLAMAIFVDRGPAQHPVLDLRSSAAAIAEALRLARSRAIVTDRPCVFVLDVGARSFRIADDPPQRLPSELAVKITTVAGAVAGKSAEIGFAPDGSSTGGRIDLAAADHKAAVEVSWLTGRVSVDAR